MAASTPLQTAGGRVLEDKTGLRTIDLVYVVEGPSTDGDEEPYELLFGFQPKMPAGLAEIERSAEKQTDGSWTLTVTCQGLSSATGTKGAVLEYDNISVEDPIEESPRFPAISSKFRAIFEPETQKFEGFAKELSDGVTGKRSKNPFYGVSHFKNNNGALTVTFNVRDFDEKYLADLCQITVPQVPSGTAKNVKTPSGMTWLKDSVKARQAGNCWQVEIRYLLGNWRPELYGPTR